MKGVGNNMANDLMFIPATYEGYTIEPDYKTNISK